MAQKSFIYRALMAVNFIKNIFENEGFFPRIKFLNFSTDIEEN